MKRPLSVLFVLSVLLARAPAATVEYTDGTTVKFNPSGNVAGVNVGAHTSDPATLTNGDLWYNSTSNALKARINGATVSLGAGGGGSTTLTSTYIGYGDGSDAVTGEAAFTYTAASDLVTLANLYATTAIEVGAATDTTLTRSSAGNLAVEGNLIYRASGTDVPVTDGGTGASTAADARTNLGLGTAAVLATSTGGNAAADSGLVAAFDASGFIRAESLYSDKNLVMGTTNTIGSGVLCTLSGSSNAVTGTGQVNSLLGSSNAIDVSSGYGLLYLHGVQNSFRTTADFGAQGQVFANGVQHYGAAENSMAIGFHNRMDGRGTFDTSSVTTLATSAQVTGAGGSAMVALGAGGHAYWHGCVFLSSHHNVDGGQIIGDVSSRDTNDGAVTAGGSLSATLILSKTNGKKLILKPHTLYQFDVLVNAGFITIQEWAAAWSYRVTVHQGAAGTTPVIRSVLNNGISSGSGTLGAVPSGWSVAFSAATQELVVTLTMANPSGSSANWTATGGFRATETAARFDGGAVTTIERTSATTADLLITASGFDGNLATTDDTLQEIAQKFDDFTAAGTGDVTAASNFAVDNVLIRSNGTTKGVQATGWTIADTDEASVTVDGAGEVAMEINATGSSGFAIAALAAGAGGIAVEATNATGAGWGVVGLSSVSGGVGILAKAGDASAIPFQIANSGNFVQSHTFAGTAARTIAWPDDAGIPALYDSTGTEGQTLAWGAEGTPEWLTTPLLASAQTFTAQNTFSKAPAISRTDLAGGTSLTIGNYYYDSLSAIRTLTFSGTPAAGNTVSLKLVVTNAPILTIPSSKRAGEANSAITSVQMYPGVHTLTWTYINAEWVLNDSVGTLNKIDGTTAPTANEDIGDGYTVGSVWIDTTNDVTYVCTDSTVTAAVWKLSGNAVTGTGSTVLATSPTIVTPAAFTTGGTITLAENTSIALDPAGSADGKYTGTTIAGTAGATLAFGDIVYLAAADSRWELADCDSATTSGNVLIGMVVLAAASDGSATTILLNGTIRADTAFPTLTISAPAYISGTAGDIQVAAPSTTGQIVRRVGFALTADELIFNPSADSGTAP